MGSYTGTLDPKMIYKGIHEPAKLAESQIIRMLGALDSP